MPTLEGVIRPFQLIPAAPPSRTRALPLGGGLATVSFSFGAGGSTKTVGKSFSSTITSYQDANMTEMSREVSTKRITNPDNENQYVDVEVTDKLEAESGGINGWQKYIINLDNSDG